MEDVRFDSPDYFFFLRIIFNIFNIFYFCYLKSKFWGGFLSKISFWVSHTLHENGPVVVRRLRFADRLCLFADHFKQFFVKFAKQNFPSIRIFLFRETTKFVFTLQTQQFSYILLEKSVKLCIIFVHLDSIFAAKPQLGILQRSSITCSCWNYSLNFWRSLLKR